jgi:hypothetical protein
VVAVAAGRRLRVAVRLAGWLLLVLHWWRLLLLLLVLRGRRLLVLWLLLGRLRIAVRWRRLLLLLLLLVLRRRLVLLLLMGGGDQRGQKRRERGQSISRCRCGQGREGQLRRRLVELRLLRQLTETGG